jgi:hypothetical protein
MVHEDVEERGDPIGYTEIGELILGVLNSTSDVEGSVAGGGLRRSTRTRSSVQFFASIALQLAVVLTSSFVGSLK